MITILQNDTQIEFLSNLRDIRFLATSGKAQVTITSRSSGALVYDEILHSAGTTFTMYDIPGLLEPFVEEMGYGESFTVRIAESDSVYEEFVMRVAYCKAEVGAFADYANNHFLSLHNNGVRTALGRQERLSLWKYATSGNITAPTASVRAYYTDGTYADSSLTMTGGSGVAPTFDPVGSETDSAAFYFASVNIDDYATSGKSLYRLVVTCEGRTKEYVIDSAHYNPYPVLLFVNSFGETEFMYCHGKVESAPEYERTNVIVNREMRSVHVKETRYWNADTGILDAEELEWAMELMRSHSTYLCSCVNGTWQATKGIVIEEQECHYTNEDDNLARYTFKYRLSQNNQIVPVVRYHPEIFTNTYTSIYD